MKCIEGDTEWTMKQQYRYVSFKSKRRGSRVITGKNVKNNNNSNNMERNNNENNKYSRNKGESCLNASSDPASLDIEPHPVSKVFPLYSQNGYI
jgi:hypothetical protein